MQFAAVLLKLATLCVIWYHLTIHSNIFVIFCLIIKTEMNKPHLPNIYCGLEGTAKLGDGFQNHVKFMRFVNPCVRINITQEETQHLSYQEDGPNKTPATTVYSLNKQQGGISTATV